ncbi:unnamed protein product, partial [Amoebophrya sp. A25]
VDPTDVKSLLARAKQVPKKLSNFEVMQAALGCPGILGRDVDCCVDAQVAEAVQKKISFQGQPRSRFPLYARPVVEKCIRELAGELEGVIYPTMMEVACLHDGQTFD